MIVYNIKRSCSLFYKSDVEVNTTVLETSQVLSQIWSQYLRTEGMIMCYVVRAIARLVGRSYMSTSGVGALGDPCTATISWSIVRPNLLYSASSPLPLTKYCILHSWILIVIARFHEMFPQVTKPDSS
jgi:hypothetical protein